MALTIPALLAERIASHGGDIVLRKKNRGIWQAVTWSQLGAHFQQVGAGLRAVGFGPGDVACVLAETRPEFAYVDLGILAAGGISGAINPAREADELGALLRQSDCRVLFVENEEQLDKALLARDQCPRLQRIVIFDMKGLREFTDSTCDSLEAFVSRDSVVEPMEISRDQPAVLLFPSGRVLSHGDVMHMVAQARTMLAPRAGDERLALLPMCDVTERLLGLYLSLDVRAVSNYLESPDTVIENLQEVQPTLLGADAQVWQRLYARTANAAAGATPLQRTLYRWGIATGGPLARFVVLNAVRRELGLRRLRCAYIGAPPLPRDVEEWTAALGISVRQIDGQTSQGIAVDARYRALMEEAYST